MLAYTYMANKILIIEDEADIREAIAEVIGDEDEFEVKTAENGQVGLNLAFEWHPDLILIDLVMPVMDGHETLKKLRQDAWGRTVKVIVLTAMSGAEDVASAHTANIADYVVKAHNSLDEILNKVKFNIHT